MTKSESKENLVQSDAAKADPESGGKPQKPVDVPDEAESEYILTDVEKRFLLAAERGDCASVRRMIDEGKEDPTFSINCVDPLNRSALISAIENENYDLIVILLDAGIEVKDALLHAISEEYVEAVEELLMWEESHHVEGQPYSWEATKPALSNFTSDITPLILAAHRNNYEILKVLLDRGATLPMPHDVKCGCDDCVSSQDQDSLRHSQSRINAYRALSSSSLMALSSRDPVLTAFELSWELKRLQRMESEFRTEYTEMREKVQEFSTSLLDHARTSTELEVMLNYDHEATNDIWTPGERQTLDRLKLAIKYKQKMFVAHPNVQQLLAAIWYDGLPGFRRKTMSQQLMDVAKLGCMFPVYSMNYIMAPYSEMGKFMKKPFVKFICHSASYAFFLMLLGAASQRVEVLALEFIGLPWMLEIVKDWKKHERGSFPGPIECGIIMYIGSLIFAELRTLYNDGLWEYISDLWNIVDFISNMFYVTWILCRATAFIIVKRDSWYRGLDPWFAREHWHPFDPMLLSEGAFAAGMIFSFLKLVHIFSINPHLGPLQVSLGRMIIDIIKFFFIYTLVLFAFGCGLNQLLWYYADLEKNKCYHLHPQVPDFDEQEKACTIWRRFANLFETSQSLFWASFGLVDLVSFDLSGIKSFTRFWALLMFGSYSVINIIVLLNMLIAMMSNSYQIISERADVEWKFARSQLWISYFDDGDTLPAPFNLCPSVKLLQKTLGKDKKKTKSVIRRSLEKAQTLHERVMRLLVRRYVTAEQRKRDDFGITEDDIMEVRQDISTLRFELLDIFAKNKMDVPDIDKKQTAGTKKGRVMERRILKDFQIGIVENLTNEIAETGGQAKDVFGTIAKVIGKKGTRKGDPRDRDGSKKKDWNAIARKNTISSDPIGSGQASAIRRSQRSLRRQAVEKANQALDNEKLLEYNPKLGDVTQTTRVAYVKFMSKTLEKRGHQGKFLLDEEKEASNFAADTAKRTSLKKMAASASVKKVDEANKTSDQSKSTAGPSSKVEKKDEKKPAPKVEKKTDEGTPPPPPSAGGASATSASKGSAPEPPPASTGGDAGKGKAPNAPAPSSEGKTEDKPKTTQAAGGDGKTGTAAASGDQKTGSDAKASGDKGGSSGGKTDDKSSTAAAAPAASAAASTSTTPAAPGVPKPGGAAPKKLDPKKDLGQTGTSAKIGQSAAAAGGDRGKSSVTGRMISGWL